MHPVFHKDMDKNTGLVTVDLYYPSKVLFKSPEGAYDPFVV